MSSVFELTSLFFSSLLAATIFPAQSEIFLASLYLANNHNPIILLLTATCGNVLGSCINWLLGRHLTHFQDRKWFFIKESKIKKYRKTYESLGIWSLLFAWLPIIGDPLTVIAGVFKVNFWLFVILVTIGKLLRYLYLLMAINVF